MFSVFLISVAISSLMARCIHHLWLVPDGDHEGAVKGREPGPASPREDVERRRAGAEVESESARAPRAPYQHPQDVILADRAAGRAAAAASVLADAEKRAVCFSFSQRFSCTGLLQLQGVQELG